MTLLLFTSNATYDVSKFYFNISLLDNFKMNIFELNEPKNM